MVNKILKQLDIAKMLFNEPKLLMLFQKSSKTFLQIEEEIREDFEKYRFKEFIKFSSTQEKSFVQNFKKNFFSILMISILHDSLDEYSKIKKYGKIIAYLRGIITATDNMIDRENKGNIKLEKPESLIVRNSLLLLMLQEELSKEVNSLGSGQDSAFIFSKIFNIAQAESLREEEQYKSYPDVDFVVDKIHSGIGGELLDLSLEVPKFYEKNNRLDRYAEGLYEIGMSLQALDDICDIKEDIEASKVNFAVSHLIYNHGMRREQIGEMEFNSDRCPEEIQTLVDNSIDRAVLGFDILKEGGYPIGRTDTLRLLKVLFEIRGLENYWKFSKYGKK